MSKKDYALFLRLTKAQNEKLQFYSRKTQLKPTEILRDLISNYLPIWYCYRKIPQTYIDQADANSIKNAKGGKIQ